MPIVYSGAHSITFIESKNGSVNIARSWLDWHLVPSSRPVVPPASPNISIVQIPGSNRSIDLTEALSGNITYARRTGSWEFIVDHDRWSDWVTAYKTIKLFLNGRRLYCILEDDHDVVYNGRFALKDWKSDSDYSRVTIDYSLDHEESLNEFTYNLKLYPATMTATFNSGSKVITNENTLNSLRRYTTTNITYDNGYSEDTDKYSLSGDLPSDEAGNKSITVTSDEKNVYDQSLTQTIYVNTQKQEIKRIVVDFRPRNKKIYSGPLAEVLNAVRKYLTVTAVWTDGKYEEIDEYELSLYDGGTQTGGTKTLTVTYLNATESFTVEVTQTVLDSITAVFDTTHKVFVGDNLDSLKDYITVTANYNSGKIETVSSYTLSGSLSRSGSKEIDVSYNSKTTSFTVNVLDIVVVSISAEFDSTHTVYSGDSLDSLKSYLTVTATRNNGDTRTVTSSDYVLSGNISTSGSKTITVTYEGKTTKFSVDVVALVVTSINATYRSSHTVYAGDSLESLKPDVTIIADYNNGTIQEIDASDYSLSGNISTSGSKTITASYGGKSDTFSVSVVAVELSRITAEYSGDTHQVYVGDSLESLKPYLTVSAVYNNGSQQTVDSYVLSGSISNAGTNTITVAYGGKSTTFKVYNVTELEVVSISAAYDSTNKVYAGDDIDSLKPYTIVTATYNSGKTGEISSYSLSGDISTSGKKTITVTYEDIYVDVTTTFTVNVTALTVNSIDASYDYSHTIYAGDSINSLKPFTTVTATYNSGSTGTIDSFGLSGDISTSGTKTILVSYGGKSTTFMVNVVAVTINSISVVYDTTHKVYAGDDIDTLKPYTTVTATYNSGATENVTSFSLVGDISTSGTKTITASYDGKTATFSVSVIALVVDSISAVYDTTHKVYAGDNINSLKPYTTVTATYNSGATENVTSFSLVGDISASGTKTITASYDGKSATFSVSVIALVVDSISAVYDTTHKVYAGDDIDTLKPYTTVTATYNSGATENVTSFSLVGDISTSGTKTITASYDGKSTTFSVDVEPPILESISASYNTSHVVYAGDDIESLKSYTTVTATYNNGTTANIASFVLSGNISTSGSKTITVTYEEKTTTFSINVVAVAVTSINATYSSSHRVYAGDSLDSLKPYTTVIAYHNNGTFKEIDASDYSLSGDISTSGTKTITASYGGKSDTFSVSVVAVELSRITAEYSNDSHQVYVGDSIETLKPYLTVTAVYNSGSEQVVDSYVLSGSLSNEGTNTINVAYSGKSTTFEVRNVAGLEVTSISASFDSSYEVYAGDDIEFLKDYTTVTATYNNGATESVTSFDLSGDISTSGTKIITVTYGEMSTTFSVYVHEKVYWMISVDKTIASGDADSGGVSISNRTNGDISNINYLNANYYPMIDVDDQSTNIELLAFTLFLNGTPTEITGLTNGENAFKSYEFGKHDSDGLRISYSYRNPSSSDIYAKFILYAVPRQDGD